jgi:hypothetical protein
VKKKGSARSRPTFMRAPWVQLEDEVLDCARCGEAEKMRRPRWPKEPRAQMEWIAAYNGQVEHFITHHELCEEGTHESVDQ